MQLKIIVVPTFIILALILSIGFIKPDYEALLQARASLKEKQDQVARIDATKENIHSLNQALDEKTAVEEFVVRYYPEAMDQERAIDSFNFMATQSGLVIDSMEMKEVVSAKKEESFGVGGPLTSVPGGEVDAPAEVVPLYRPPMPSSFVAQVRAKGDYENIKNFLHRLSRMDRMNALVTLSVDVDEKEKKEGESEVSGQLIGTFEARFDYVKNKTGQNALGVPIFGSNTLEIQKLEEEIAWASSAVPILQVDQSGRSNPFQ